MTEETIKQICYTKEEVDSMIAFAVYEEQIYTSGISMRKSMQEEKLLKYYMPSDSMNDDRMSYVDMFLKAKSKFKSLYN